MSEHILIPVTKDRLATVWPHVLPLIEEGIGKQKERRYSLEGIMRALADELWSLWFVWEKHEADKGKIKAVVMAEINVAQSGMKFASITFLSGHDRKHWFHLLEHIEDWARANGCERMEMQVRRGIAKFLPDYNCTHMVLGKDLDGRLEHNDTDTDQLTVRASDTAA